jgi:hypothetical protein
MKKLLENWRSYEKEALNEVKRAAAMDVMAPDEPIPSATNAPPDRLRAPRVNPFDQEDMSKNEIETLLRVFGDTEGDPAEFVSKWTPPEGYEDVDPASPETWTGLCPGCHGEAPIGGRSKKFAKPGTTYEEVDPTMVQAIQMLNRANYMLRGENRARLEEYIDDPETTDAQIWLDTGGEYSSRRDIEDSLRASWSHVIFDPYDPVDYANAALFFAGGAGVGTKAVTVAAKLNKSRDLMKLAENSNNILKARAYHKKAGTLKDLQKSGLLKDFFNSTGKRIKPVAGMGDLPRPDQILKNAGITGEALQAVYWLAIDPQISAEFEESEIARYLRYQEESKGKGEKDTAEEEEFNLDAILGITDTEGGTSEEPEEPEATVTTGEPEIEIHTDEDIDPETGLFPGETEEDFVQKSIDSGLRENKNMKDLMENWRSYGASVEKDLLSEGPKLPRRPPPTRAADEAGETASGAPSRTGRTGEPPAPARPKRRPTDVRTLQDGAREVTNKERRIGKYPEGLVLDPEFADMHKAARDVAKSQLKEAGKALGPRPKTGTPEFNAYMEKATALKNEYIRTANRIDDHFFEVQDHYLQTGKRFKNHKPPEFGKRGTRSNAAAGDTAVTLSNGAHLDIPTSSSKGSYTDAQKAAGQESIIQRDRLMGHLDTAIDSRRQKMVDAGTHSAEEIESALKIHRDYGMREINEWTAWYNNKALAQGPMGARKSIGTGEVDDITGEMIIDRSKQPVLSGDLHQPWRQDQGVSGAIGNLLDKYPSTGIGPNPLTRNLRRHAGIWGTGALITGLLTGIAAEAYIESLEAQGIYLEDPVEAVDVPDVELTGSAEDINIPADADISASVDGDEELDLEIPSEKPAGTQETVLNDEGEPVILTTYESLDKSKRIGNIIREEVLRYLYNRRVK